MRLKCRLEFQICKNENKSFAHQFKIIKTSLITKTVKKNSSTVNPIGIQVSDKSPQNLWQSQNSYDPRNFKEPCELLGLFLVDRKYFDS